MIALLFRRRTACAAAAIGLALGCSWDYPAWPKSKLSDTALFRFVVNDRDGAGYIDRTGKIVIPPRYQAFGNNSGGDFLKAARSCRSLMGASSLSMRRGQR